MIIDISVKIMIRMILVFIEVVEIINGIKLGKRLLLS